VEAPGHSKGDRAAAAGAANTASPQHVKGRSRRGRSNRRRSLGLEFSAWASERHGGCRLDTTPRISDLAER
jgi:hypothetical protein